MRWIVLCVAMTIVLSPSPAAAQRFGGPSSGQYELTTPAGKKLTVCYGLPVNAGPDTRIVIVIPGALRNAVEYRDDWRDPARKGGFIVLAVGASLEEFPTEYDYNAGGLVDPDGKIRPRRERLFAAIEPLFDDFLERTGSHRRSYSLYGHSAGGTFVMAFLLAEPDARVDRAVAANPAFCPVPDAATPYPFGIGGLGLVDDELRAWFSRPLVVLLGDRDLEPRHNPLSNGPEALRQGPHVYARGLGFFQAALVQSDHLKISLAWKLQIATGVGHSNRESARHAMSHFSTADHNPTTAPSTTGLPPSN
jgi:pimeloyl-ACP methyl ester carboxylesterase